MGFARIRRLSMPVVGAFLVVLGFWIGGKYHPWGFVLAAIPIGIWGVLHLQHWLRRRRDAS